MLSCLATEQGRQQGSRKSPSRSAECSSTEWPGIDREGRLLQDCKAVPFPRSALGHLSCPQKSDVQLPGVRRSQCEAGQTRTGENISPRPSLSTRSRTIRQWEIIGKKKTPLKGTTTAEQEGDGSRGKGLRFFKRRGGRGCLLLGNLSFCWVLLSLCLQKWNVFKPLPKHTKTFLFSFGTTPKDTQCHVQHPWGLYLISEQDGLPAFLMPDSSWGEARSGNSIFQRLWQNEKWQEGQESL